MKKSKLPVLDSNCILRLTHEQQIAPQGVIDEFFSTYHLADVRKQLWDWLAAGLTNDKGAFRDGRSRSNLLFLYEQLEAFTEATFLVQQQQTNPR